MKVFGIGYHRTGTKSLTAALDVLGIRAIHYPEDPRTYGELRRGNYRLSILEEYDGLTDLPAVPFYPQYDALYSGSKFILTVRNSKEWLQSVIRHFEDVKHLDWPPDKLEFDQFMYACAYGCHEVSPERFIYCFDSHRAQVTDYFRDRPNDLLVMDICQGDGWERLCQFLQKPVPTIPFPRAR